MKKIKIILILLTGFISNSWAIGNSKDANTERDSKINAEVKAWTSHNNHVKFLDNKGQMTDLQGKASAQLLFKVSGSNADLYITDKGLSYVFTQKEKTPNLKSITKGGKPNYKTRYGRALMELVGADIRTENVVKEYASEDVTDYYLPQCPKGVRGVHSYGKITIRNVYPGIDWVFSSSKENASAMMGLEYEFVVHPGADPGQIKLRYHGTEKPQMLSDGSVKVNTVLGNFLEGSPVSFLENEQNQIGTQYIITDNDLSFKVDNYKTDQTLIIDPTLIWSTYFPTVNEFNSIHTDGSHVWVAGTADGTLIPPIISPDPAAFHLDSVISGAFSMYMAEFDTSGRLLWSTYYGGSDFIMPASIYSDGRNVWVYGTTNSPDLPRPIVPGAYNKPIDSISYWSNGEYNFETYVTKFSCNNDSLLWATYYGGVNNEYADNNIVSDGKNVFIAGYTASYNLPVVKPDSGAYSQHYAGGRSDAFIAEFNCDTMSLKWATFLGGSGGSVTDLMIDEAIYSITIDSSHIWVAGTTESYDFPIKNLTGAHNQATKTSAYGTFVSEFNYKSDSMIWSTYYDSAGNNIICDGNKYVYLVPYQLSSATSAEIRRVHGGGQNMCFQGGNVWAAGSTTGVANYTNTFSDSCGYYNLTNAHIDSFYNSDGVISRMDTTGIVHYISFYGSNSGSYYGAWAAHNFIYGGSSPTDITTDGTYIWTIGFGEASDQQLMVNPGGGVYFNNPFATHSNFQPHVVPIISKFLILCPHECPALTWSIGNDVTICSGDSITYCAPEGYGSYAWSNGDTLRCSTIKTPGLYNLQVTDNGGCTAVSNHVTVTNYAPTTIVTSQNGDTLRVYNADNIQWLNNGIAIPGANSPLYVVNSPGTYTVQVVDSNGCTAFSNQINLTGINSVRGSQISVYPNPLSTGGWHVIVDQEMIGSVCELVDADGRVVYSTIINNRQSEIVPNVERGLYLLRLTSATFSFIIKLTKI